MFLLAILVIGLLVATFIMFSGLPQQSSATAITEIQAPDNSAGKAIPRLYGKARLNGNNIFYGNLEAVEIVVEY